MKHSTLLAIALAIISLPAAAQLPTMKPHKQRVASTIGQQSAFSRDMSQPNGTLVMAPRQAASAVTRTLSYCDGAYNTGIGLGSLSKGDSLVGAILFTKEQLAPYKGGRITKLLVPAIQKQGLQSVYGWVGVGAYESATTLKKLSSFKAGYNELTLDEAITIDCESDIYIGASYVLKKTATTNQTYCIPVNTTATEVDGGLLVGFGKKTATSLTWEDDSNSGSLGNFAVEAVVEGVETEAIEAKLTSLSLANNEVRTTGTLIVTVGVKNNGTTDISSFDVAFTINGTDAGTLAVTPSTAFTTDRTYSATMNLPINLAETTKDAVLKATLKNVNGQGDDADTSDNSATTTFSAYELMFPHKILVEEGTGQWCGYCPRGTVAMDEMHDKNLDDFVGIAVHYGYYSGASTDSMAFVINSQGYMYANVVDYSGFPIAVFDKKYEADPSYCQDYYDYLTSQESTASVYGRAYWDGDNVVVSGDVQFSYSAPAGSNYRLLTFLIEDEVGPYYQTNNYAGGSLGEMGGFEKLDSPTPIIYNDVLRGIYPDVPSDYVLGEQLTEATDNGIEGGKAYQFEYTYPITATVQRLAVVNNKGKLVDDSRYQNRDNLRMAIALLDYDNGGVAVNACKMAIAPDKESAINGVTTAKDAPIEYYTIGGVRLNGPATKGIYIEKQGSKVVKRMATK